MKEELKEIINECNAKRSNIYYMLSQLPEITGLSIRTLKYRMLAVKRKYDGVTSLLLREGRNWKIHYTLVKEFMPIRKRKSCNINTFDWTSMVTWTTNNDYDVTYHIELVRQVKALMPQYTISYSVEKTKKQINHVHFITNAAGESLETTVRSVLNQYWDEKEYRLQVNKLNNKYSSVRYLMKSPEAYNTI